MVDLTASCLPLPARHSRAAEKCGQEQDWDEDSDDRPHWTPPPPPQYREKAFFPLGGPDCRNMPRRGIRHCNMCYNIVQLFNWFRSILCGNFYNWGKVRCVETQAWHTDRRGGAGWRRRRRAGFELGPSSSSAPAEAFRQEKKGGRGDSTRDRRRKKKRAFTHLSPGPDRCVI